MLMSEFTAKDFADILRGRADWEKRISDNTRGMESANHDSNSYMLNEAADRICPRQARKVFVDDEPTAAPPATPPPVRRARRSVGKNAGKLVARKRAKARSARRVRRT